MTTRARLARQLALIGVGLMAVGIISTLIWGDVASFWAILIGLWLIAATPLIDPKGTFQLPPFGRKEGARPSGSSPTRDESQPD